MEPSHEHGSAAPPSSKGRAGEPTRPMPQQLQASDTQVRLTPITGRVSRAKKGVPVHVCDICKPHKTFTRVEHLRHHRLSHELPQFQCPVCDKSFHRLDLLSRHQQKNDHGGDIASKSGSTQDSPRPSTATAPSSWAGQAAVHSPGTEMSTPPVSNKFYNLEELQSYPLSGTMPPMVSVISPESYYPPRTALPVPLYPVTDHDLLVPGLQQSGYHEQLLEHQQQDDLGAVYSDKERLQVFDADAYIDAFAAKLSFNCSTMPYRIALNKALEALPWLLRGFSSRIGYESTTKECHNIMHFAHKFRNQILKRVRQNTVDDNAEQGSECRADEGMNVVDKMALWIDRQGKNQDVSMGAPNDLLKLERLDDGGLEHPEDLVLPVISEFHSLLDQSPAFAWLHSSFVAETNLEVPDAGHQGIRQNMQEQVIEAMIATSRRLSRRDFEKASVLFKVFWDFPSFYRTQEFKGTMKDILLNSITFTGAKDQVQAVTCLEYMRQLWPQTGPLLLEFLGELYEGDTSNGAVPLTNNLSLVAQLHDGYLEIQAFGDPFSVAELGTQFAWLGAALRVPQTASGLDDLTSTGPSSCLPWQTCTNSPDAEHPAITCKTGYSDTVYPDMSGDTRNGSCWRSAVGGVSIVEGFPIPRRDTERPNSGMEAPIGIMAEMINARKIVIFRGFTFIKGFSAMLRAVEVAADTIYWHLFFNKDGQYISYEDSRIPRQSDNFGCSDIDLDNPNTRHILGWCVEINNYTGTRDANYSINWSGLPGPTPSCAFEKVSITAGRYITTGVTCAIGVKQRPVHLRIGDDYLGMLNVVSGRYFLFYDRDDHRAWLVDGASALLHILRTSIKHFQDDRRLRNLFCFNYDEFEEPTQPYIGADAAFEALLNLQNRSLHFYQKTQATWKERSMKPGAEVEDVYKQKIEMFCLEDRVEQICHILGQIMAHYDDVSTKDGVGFRILQTPRRHLEGFDFMDVATSQGTLWPKATQLHTSGAGWVDFTRTIHAITLFGSGFGELFKPAASSSCGSCMSNSEVPKGKDYLAATVTEIKEILKKQGCMRTNPWRLADKVHWHTPDKIFEPCKCSNNKSTNTQHDRVQVLLPATFPKLWGRKLRSPSKLPSQGMVVFGHSWKFPLRLNAKGDVEEGEPEVHAEEFERVLHDSGIDMGNSSSVKSESTSDRWLYSMYNSKSLDLSNSLDTADSQDISDTSLRTTIGSSPEPGDLRTRYRRLSPSTLQEQADLLPGPEDKENPRLDDSSSQTAQVSKRGRYSDDSLEPQLQGSYKRLKGKGKEVGEFE